MRWLIFCAAAAGCGQQLVEFPLDATVGDLAGSTDLAGSDLVGADLAGVDQSTTPDLAQIDSAGQDLLTPGDQALPSDMTSTSDLFDACQDNLLDGTESDVDCGGNTCPQCAAGKSCRGPNDCASGMCVAKICR